MAMQPIQPMTGSPYGGVRSLRMTAPQAPSGTVQGQALSGQNRVVDGLTMQAQQTMGVPATPVKGLLKRIDAAKAAAPYVHARLSSTEIKAALTEVTQEEWLESLS